MQGEGLNTVTGATWRPFPNLLSSFSSWIGPGFHCKALNSMAASIPCPHGKLIHWQNSKVR